MSVAVEEDSVISEGPFIRSGNPVARGIVERNPTLRRAFAQAYEPGVTVEYLQELLKTLGQAITIHQYEEIVISEERLTKLLRDSN